MASAVPALNILAVFLADSGYAVLAGALLAGLWPGTDSLQETLRRVSIFAISALVAAHVVRPWFVASSMSGSTRFGEAFALIPTILSSTRQGGIWYTNSALLILAGAQLPRWKRAAANPRWIPFLLLCLLAATKAASTHASEDGDFSAAEVAEFLHLLGTAVWAGAILISGAVIVPRLFASGKPALLWAYGRRLSGTVTWALAALVLSGLFTAWRDIHGNIREIPANAWGEVLMVKVALAGLAAVLGAATRFRCLARSPSVERAASITRFLRAEALVMAIILLVSALLANRNPGT